MSGRNKLADIPGKPLPERQSNLLADLWDEATGAFARYGRRSGAQRDASLAMLNQAVDPNTDPLTGAGMKALGLAGLVTHPLAFFPTREEWDERLTNAGNDSRMSRSIGGFLSDLPSLIDPQMAAGGTLLAAAPLVGKMAKPGLGKGLGDLMQDAASNKELDALGARLQAEAAQVGGSPSAVSRDQALQGLVGGGDEGITAYHGSPHSFDKFDMSKIGTGEGAQDYGRGLYFADNEGTAISYRDVLASNKEISQDNLSKLTPDEMFRIGEEIQKAGDAAGFNTSNPNAFNMVLNRIAGHKSTTMHPAHDRAMLALDEVVKVIPDEIKAIVSEKITPPKGSLYKVKIDARPEELATYTGANGGDAIAFAEKAKRDGFKGVRYLDAKSRDSGAGSYNYVIFDDKLVTILKKYGIPMTAGAGGAMMVAGQDMPPDIASQMGGT